MAQKQNGKNKFFQSVDKFGDLFFLNLLVVLASLPIITIGAAFTAMYSYTNKLVHDNEGASVWKSFWKEFRKNFKDATKAWAVILIILVVMVIEFAISYDLQGNGYAIMLSVIALEAVYLSFTLPILFPLIARYENTTANMFKNSIIIAISNIRIWAKLFFLWALPIALYALSDKILVYSWYLWILILISIIAYASSMVLVELYDKLEHKDDDAKTDEDSKKKSEADKDVDDSNEDAENDAENDADEDAE